MYNCVYDYACNNMDDSRAAKCLVTPVRMNSFGAVAEKEDTLGCKIIHHLMLPELCIEMDEVLGNMNQKGDRNKGDQPFVRTRL